MIWLGFSTVHQLAFAPFGTPNAAAAVSDTFDASSPEAVVAKARPQPGVITPKPINFAEPLLVIDDETALPGDGLILVDAEAAGPISDLEAVQAVDQGAFQPPVSLQALNTAANFGAGRSAFGGTSFRGGGLGGFGGAASTGTEPVKPEAASAEGSGDARVSALGRRVASEVAASAETSSSSATSGGGSTSSGGSSNSTSSSNGAARASDGAGASSTVAPTATDTSSLSVASQASMSANSGSGAPESTSKPTTASPAGDAPTVQAASADNAAAPTAAAVGGGEFAATIPEPGQMLLMALGLAAVASRRVRAFFNN